MRCLPPFLKMPSRTLFTLLLVFIIGFVVSTSPAQAAVQPVGATGTWELMFQDEFEGSSLDASKWTPNWLGGSMTAITKPVNGLEKSCYDPKQVSVSGGELLLKAEARSCNSWKYASGLIQSNGKFNFTYGYMEARMWLPAGKGLWPAFWTDGQNWPKDGEIDILEAYGDNEATYHYHFAGCGGDCGPGGGVEIPGATSGWHTYAAYWEPGAITWYYDGKQVWKYAVKENVISAPHYLIANLGVDGDPAAVPATLRVDYIRVWKAGSASGLPTSVVTSSGRNTVNTRVTPTPVPSATPSPTPRSLVSRLFATATPRPSATPTPTPTASPTSRPSMTPTPRSTPRPHSAGSAEVQQAPGEIFTPVADAFARRFRPRRSYGSENLIKVGGITTDIAYLRFAPGAGVGRKIKSAVLVLNTRNASNGQQAVRWVEKNDWSESELSFMNRPRLGEVLGKLRSHGKAGKQEVMLEGLVGKTLPATFTLGVSSSAVDGYWFSSRETERPPELRIIFE